MRFRAYDRAMPELPDILVYVACLAPRIVGRRLERVRVAAPFLLRTVEPPLASVEGRTVEGVRRVGKRIVLALDHNFFIVLHLMIAGRLHWKAPGAAVPKKHGLAAFDFPTGSLLLTEAGSKRRASLHLAAGQGALDRLDPGGLEVLEAPLEQFAEQLRAANHTLKRSLTDPHLFSGIGNAYSDEILHAARLSPLQLTANLKEEEIRRLHEAVIRVLTDWTARLLEDAANGFPEHVTAFREGMAVHGRFGQPCPVCGAPIQRIVYAENEANYCARCQTGGRLLADRALSRLLREDWPKRLPEE